MKTPRQIPITFKVTDDFAVKLEAMRIAFEKVQDWPASRTDLIMFALTMLAKKLKVR